jgi:hypothetical protein
MCRRRYHSVHMLGTLDVLDDGGGLHWTISRARSFGLAFSLSEVAGA